MPVSPIIAVPQRKLYGIYGHLNQLLLTSFCPKVAPRSLQRQEVCAPGTQQQNVKGQQEEPPIDLSAKSKPHLEDGAGEQGEHQIGSRNASSFIGFIRWESHSKVPNASIKQEEIAQSDAENSEAK